MTDSAYSSILELGRRATSYPQKGVPTPDSEQLSRLKAIVTSDEDFEDASRISNKLSGLADWQTVYITLATSRANAGSAAAFEKIDRECEGVLFMMCEYHLIIKNLDVVNAAQGALRTGSKQRLVYCSSTGADPRSSFLYMRSKGLTEQALASIGYDETIIFRPGFLRVQDGRDTPRTVETVYGTFTKFVLSRFSANAEIDTPALGKAMNKAGQMGIQALLQAGIGETVNIGKEGQQVCLTPSTILLKLTLLPIQALVISNADAAKLASQT